MCVSLYSQALRYEEEISTDALFSVSIDHKVGPVAVPEAACSEMVSSEHVYRLRSSSEHVGQGDRMYLASLQFYCCLHKTSA